MFESCSSNVTLLFYQNRTPPWIFSEEYSDYFRDLYFLVSQIIIVLIQLRKGNCLNVKRDIL